MHICSTRGRWVNNELDPYPSGLLHWHWDYKTIAPVKVKYLWRVWMNTPNELDKSYWYDGNKTTESKNILWVILCSMLLNTLRPRQNGRHFLDDIFKCIFLNENVCIAIKISLKFVPSGPINTIPALVEIMAWRRPGDKPLSQPMMVNLLTHICVTRPQWVRIGT